MQQSDTKKKILEVSLNLFSRKGYSAVSVRDICGLVEIKESSVYYHFKNKRAILDELIQQYQNTASAMMGQLTNALNGNQEKMQGDFYENVCNCFFEQYLMDDFCNKVMRVLLIEQFHDEQLQQLYDEWLFQEPLKFQSTVFSALMEMGVIPKGDSNYLAVKYYAPIFFFAQRWLFTGTLSEEKKNYFRADAYGHIQKFFTEMERG